jgi:hypothetical protein
MGWTVEQAQKVSAIAPTPKGTGLTATIKVTVRDSGDDRPIRWSSAPCMTACQLPVTGSASSWRRCSSKVSMPSDFAVRCH